MPNLLAMVARVLDALGLLALAVATLVLGAALWFSGDMLAGMFFDGFFPGLAAAVACFAVARLIDIACHLRAHGDPRCERRAGEQASRPRTVFTLFGAGGQSARAPRRAREDKLDDAA